MQFIQIKTEGAGRLHRHGFFQHAGGYKRITIAVTTDPAAHLHKARQFLLAESGIFVGQQILQSRIQLRQLAQEGVIVKTQAIFDLIEHRQFRSTQHTGLPQGQHRAAQGFFVGSRLFRRQLHTIALIQQACDHHLAIQNTLALHLGRMRSQYRRDLRSLEKILQLLRALTGCIQRCNGVRQATLTRCRACDLMRAGAAYVMLIFSQIHQM